MRSIGHVLLCLVMTVALSPIVPQAAWAAGGNGGGSDASGTQVYTLNAGAQPSGGRETLDVDATVWDGSIDTSWYSVTGTEFTLDKPAQVAGLAQIVRGSATDSDGTPIAKDAFTGKTVRLGSDITLNAVAVNAVDATQRNWVPIGDVNDGVESDSTIFFDGTFDGQGHVFKNIYINGAQTAAYNYGGYQGLFGALGSNAVIENTGVDGGYIYGRAAGGIASISHVQEGESVPQIIACYNTATIVGNGSNTRGAGGIFGGEAVYGAHGTTVENKAFRAACYIANCYNTGTINGGQASPVGGIAGIGSLEVFGCYTTGRVTGLSTHVASTVGVLLTDGYAGASTDGVVTYPCGGRAHEVYATPSTGEVFYYYVGKSDASLDSAKAVELASDGLTWESDAGYRTDDYLTGEMAWTWMSHSFVDGADASSYPRLYWEVGAPQADISSINGLKVDSIGNQRYSGKPIEPDLVVSYPYADPEDGSITWLELTYGADYRVVYRDNVEAGTATVEIHGFGRYTGRLADVTFQIVQSDISNCTVDPIQAQWFYGDSIEPAVVVRNENGIVLEKGTDYTVAYSDNDRPGTGKVTVAAAGASAFGETDATFQILDVPAGLRGSGTETDPYVLSTKGELQFLAHATHDPATAGTYAAASYAVTADIDASSSDPAYLADRPVDPLFEGKGLAGTFDGMGHTITIGLTDDAPSFSTGGLLAFIIATEQGAQASIRDLTIDGSVKSSAWASALLGVSNADTTIENCVNKASVAGDGYLSGGAAGLVCEQSDNSDITIRNCSNEGTISSVGSQAGGIIGIAKGYECLIEDCVNSGTVKAGSLGAGGGIIACAGPSAAPTSYSLINCNITIQRCSNTGDVSASSADAGGILGFNQVDVKTICIDRCFNTGAVTQLSSTVNDYPGGIVGQIYNEATISNCYNVGPVRTNGSSFEAGGIVGYYADSYYEGPLTIENCYNAGQITVQGNFENTGGIIGMCSMSRSTCDLVNCYYLNTSANSHVGYTGFISGTVSEATAMDDGAMKVPFFVTQLGRAFVFDETGANGGYPVLFTGTPVETTSIADCTISPIPDWNYTGSDIAPAITVTAPDGIALVEGEDYILFIQDEGDGTATAIVRGMGAWDGYQDASFTVVPCDITRCVISPLEAKGYAEFAGEKVTQDIAVKNPAGFAMAEGADFRVAYSLNGKAGTAYVLISGMAPHYTGRITLAFTIEPGDISQLPLTGMEEHYPLDGDKLFVYDVLTAPNGYELGRAGAVGVGEPDYTRKFLDSEGNVVRSKSGADAQWLERAGAYTLVLEGTGNWTGEQRFPFTYGNDMASEATIAGIAKAYPYTGDAINVEPVVLDADGDAVDADQYEVTILDSTGQPVDEVMGTGEYTVHVDAVGFDWYGSAETMFTVVPSNYYLTVDNVSGIEAEYTLSDSGIAPEPVVTSRGRELKEGTHYTVTYQDASGADIEKAMAAGNYKVTVAGIGSYSGAVSVDFAVVPVYLCVYAQEGADGEKVLAASYSKKEFEALCDVEAAKANPVSGMYRHGTDRAWQVVSTNRYVTLDDLLADAGVDYTTDARTSLKIQTYGHEAEAVSIVDLLASNRFYPGLGAFEMDASSGYITVPAVFSITSKSGTVASAGGAGSATTGALEEANLAVADQTDEPRFIYGITEGQLLGNEEVRGVRYEKNVSEVVVITEPASAVDKSALESAIAAARAAESGVATSTDGANVADGKKWTTAAEKKALDDAIAAAQRVADDAKATQAQVDAQAAALTEAASAYDSAKKLWHRIWGATAPDTMRNIASRFGKASYAFVTTNASYKDALAASALAGKYNGIVLMTKKGSLTAQTKAALQASGVSTVYIVGSTNDVTAATQSAIKKVPGVKNVWRVNGASASAKAIATAKVGGKKSDTVIIATQNGFEDALSIAPYSYATKSPILYAETNKKLSGATTSFIKSAGYKKAIVVGGPIALPASIDTQLKSAGVTQVTRLAGSNSYATSYQIAQWATGRLSNGNYGTYKGKTLAYVRFQPSVKMSADKLAVSTGQNWLDALAGAALCGKNRSVLLLADAKTAKSNYTLAPQFCKSAKADIKTAAYVFGGTSAVQAKVWDALVASTK